LALALTAVRCFWLKVWTWGAYSLAADWVESSGLGSVPATSKSIERIQTIESIESKEFNITTNTPVTVSRKKKLKKIKEKPKIWNQFKRKIWSNYQTFQYEKKNKLKKQMPAENIRAIWEKWKFDTEVRVIESKKLFK